MTLRKLNFLTFDKNYELHELVFYF